MSSRWKSAISSVVKTLGTLGSKPEKRLSECLPPADKAVTDSQGQVKDYQGWHVFGSEFARTQFIKAVLILLSENGEYDLTNLTFDNFYSRAYDETGNIWYTASIVAMEDFNIRHSIMAPSAGTTKATAFRLLMLEVELRLSELLRESSNSSALPRILTPQSQSTFQSEDKEPEITPTTEVSVSQYSQRTAGTELEPVEPLHVNTAANLSVSNILRRSFTMRY